MSLLEAEAQTVSAFKSNVEDLALEELSRLDLRQLDLQGRLTVVQDEIKAVKAILRATSLKSAKPKKKEPSKAGAPFKLSVEREDEVVSWLTGNKDEITSSSAREQFPNWSGSYVNMALKHLRENGVLRLAATSGGQNIYRSLI